ncbi:MAG: hypothetical protein ACFFE4_01605 [Candidatus Thorarchaeota archaeon]
MKILSELGMCPSCGGELIMYKTSNYKRFVKCENCELSYAVPKKGKISNSMLQCPKQQVPILIIERPNQKAYFWADQPCFGCIGFDKCKQVKELETEFKALEVYGY